MEDSDYDIDFYTADPVVLEQYQALGGQVEGKVDPREHLEVRSILLLLLTVDVDQTILTGV